MMHHILLLGAGSMGKTHANAYSQMKEAKVVGIVDIRPEQASKAAELLGCPVFTTYEEAKEQLDQIDVVDICLPTPLHSEYIRKAADDGKHVICEKPLARNAKQAREAIDYCNAKGVQLYVGHVVRFFPEYELAKQRIESGVIGKPAVAHLSRCGYFPTGADGWYADYEKSGGTPLDLMIHDFDFLRYVFGEVESVYAKGTYNKGIPNRDYTWATLRFKNCVIAHVEGSWSHERFTTKFEFAGDKGIIDYDSSKETALVLERKAAETGKRGVAVPSSPMRHSPYFKELKHFLECIEQGKKPIVTAEDALEAVRIAECVIESITSGKRIEL